MVDVGHASAGTGVLVSRKLRISRMLQCPTFRLAHVIVSAVAKAAVGG